MASLSLRHVEKRYPNGYVAVKDFNLEIADKEFVIFVGPSGCGKSTTLRMIAGLEDISSGELYIDDKLVNDVEPKDRDIAMVFQNYALYPHMSVYDNMAFGLKLRKTPKDEIDKLVQEAARIYVTHDQTEAMTLGTRIVVMKDGIVQQVDSPQNLYDKPGNKFVAGFIGAPQMNLVDATVAKSGSDVTLTFGGDTIALPADKAKKLEAAGYVGKTVTMGPEDLHDDEAWLAANPKAVLTTTIRVYEMLGAEVFLYFDIQDTSCTARVNPRTTARPGDTVKLAMDLTKIHIFDKDTENVVLN